MKNTDLVSLFRNKDRANGNLISIVLPLYNEEASVPLVLEELYSFIKSQLSHYRFEITFVDDCSKDNSFRTVVTEAEKAPANVRVSIVKLAKNSGSHIAITAGLNIVRGDFVIIMASDGQDPAEVIKQLITEWENGNELVLASRSDNLDHSMAGKFFSNAAWKLMNWSTNIKMPFKGCDLLGMDKMVLDAFNSMDERNTTFIYRILSLGFQQKEIEYVKRARVAGKGSWTFWKKIRIMTDAIAGFSSRPLRLIINIGLIIFLLLMSRWLWVVVKVYLLKETPSEFSIVVNLILTSLAIQMLVLGFIGDYIWRILDETRKRPIYEISKVEGSIF